MGIGGWIVIAVVALLVVWFVFTYNGLVTARNRTQEAWSEIDVELKRRHDLIPNLVNTVQGYVGHERGTLEAVTNARAAAVAAGPPAHPPHSRPAPRNLTHRPPPLPSFRRPPRGCRPTRSASSTPTQAPACRRTARSWRAAAPREAPDTTAPPPRPNAAPRPRGGWGPD